MNVLLVFAIIFNKLSFLIVLQIIYKMLIPLFTVILLVTFILFFANENHDPLIIWSIVFHTFPFILYLIFLVLLKMFVSNMINSSESNQVLKPLSRPIVDQQTTKVNAQVKSTQS